MKTDTIEEILEALKKHDSFLIVGHLQPDPDCISSQWGLARFLKEKGKKVTLANAGPMREKDFEPYRDSFLDTVTPILPQLKTEKTVMIVTDCSSADRLGSLEPETKDLFTIVIDHHANGDENFGDLRFIDPQAPSTTILIKRIICAWDASLLPPVAKILFWGFCTDSGYFRFLQSYSAPYFHDIADLVTAGAVPSETYAFMTYGKSLLSRRFIAEMISRMKGYHGNRFFLATVTRRIERKYGDEKDTSVFFELVTAVRECEMIALIKRNGFRRYTVSLRSREPDIGSLALSYGGGGHKLAAGFRFKGSLRRLKKSLIRDTKRLLIAAESASPKSD